MSGVKILPGIFLILSLVLGFLFLNNPFQEIKELAQLNLFFLVSAAFMFIIFLRSPKLQKIQLESAREFFDEYSTGLFLGLGVSGIAAALALGLNQIVNFTGSVSAMSVAVMSDTALVFLVHVLPLVETMILVGTTVVLGSFLKGKIPFSFAAAGVIAAVFFAGFHFAAVSGGEYEYSVQGFLDFVRSPNGALIHLSFGLVSVALFLGFGSFVIPWSVHHMNNLIAAAGIVGWSPLLTGILVLDVGIVVLTLTQGQFKRWKHFSVKEVLQ